jgi:FKBP-type peptidyl-prolyl cis-trans isomerase FkpA
MKKLLGLILIFSVVFTACKKETRTLKEIEDEQIQTYIKSNSLTGFIKDPSGFYYQILNPGTGDQLKYSSYVSIAQKTTSINETVNYEFTIYAPQADYLGYVTPIAWRETLVKVKRGAEVRILTPSYLAFGKNGSGTFIPGNAILDTKITVPDDRERVTYEDKLMREFLASKNITAVKDPSGLYYQIISPGTGASITSTTATLQVSYIGRYLTGAIFDQAPTGSPITLGINNVIEGWKIGVPLIKEGGKIRLVIPSRLAYGDTPPSGIPINSILDFDIELVKVTN